MFGFFGRRRREEERRRREATQRDTGRSIASSRSGDDGYNPALYGSAYGSDSATHSHSSYDCGSSHSDGGSCSGGDGGGGGGD